MVVHHCFTIPQYSSAAPFVVVGFFLQHFHFQRLQSFYCIHINLLPFLKSTCVCCCTRTKMTQSVLQSIFFFMLHSPMFWKSFTRKMQGEPFGVMCAVVFRGRGGEYLFHSRAKIGGVCSVCARMFTSYLKERTLSNVCNQMIGRGYCKQNKE